MKNQKGFTLTELMFVLFFVVVVGVFGISWVANAYKLVVSDDFESPYKAEILHGVGLFTVVLAPFTVWVDDEKQEENQ